MKQLRWAIPILSILSAGIIVSILWADPEINPIRENRIGQETFAKVTEIVRQKYEKETDSASLYESAWKSLEMILPATGTLTSDSSEGPATVSPIQPAPYLVVKGASDSSEVPAAASVRSTSDQIRRHYLKKIQETINQYTQSFTRGEKIENRLYTLWKQKKNELIASATSSKENIASEKPTGENASPSPKETTPTTAISQIESATEEEKDQEDRYLSVSKLWNQVTSGLVGGLKDPFSQFLPPTEHKELQRQLSGKPDENRKFYGVGISVDWDTEGDSGLMVIAPLPDTPADRNGIKPGDIIVAVEGDWMKTWKGTYAEKLDKAINKIKGEKDTQVTLTIKRSSNPEPFDITLTRAPINPDQYLSKEMLDNEIGLLQLRNFHANATEDVLSALRFLKMSGMKKLIFDMRFNPGGYLDQAVKVADIFLKKDLIITYTFGRSSDAKYFMDESTSEEGFTDIPMVVLIHQWSASAAEVVTGALKDNKRATIIGKKSFGKGSVQEVFNLDNREDGPALRLTVARYYTPSGVCIHEVGIEPDIDVDSKTEEEYLKLKDKQYNHVTRLDRLFDRDPQLKTAYQFLRGEVTAEDFKKKDKTKEIANQNEKTNGKKNKKEKVN